MVSSYRASAWAVALLFLSLAPMEIFAQSKDPRALNLFNQAAGESDVSKKIATYKQVVEADPLFVEAFFNLGVLYRQQQDYHNAELSFLQAAKAAPGRSQTELKGRILHELSGVYKRVEKFKECEENLRAAKPFVSDKELRSMISFDLGRLLFDQQRYEEAFAELKEGQKLSAKNKTYFANFLQAAERGIELQKLYGAARQTEAGGDLQEARTWFGNLQAKSPGYKDVEARLAILDSLLSPETQRRQSLAARYQQAGKLASEGNFILAIAIYESIVQEDGKYKDAPTLLDQARQHVAAQQRATTLEGEYATGAAALHAQNWTRAIITFERILEMDENYRDARALLKEAQINLERESAESICVRYYADGVAAMNQKDLGSALAAFEKVKRLNPNYRDLPMLLGLVERELQSQSSAASATFTAGASRTASANGLVPDASNEGDRGTAVSRGGNAGAPHVLYIASAVAALIILPLVGFLFFSPSGRARLYLLFGNYSATMRIYENMLIRHPERARLNPTILNTLATHYLLERRIDERALDVYQHVQKLNLPASNRDEISAILRQHYYLAAGKKSTDAADMLEQLLKSKNSRMETST